MGTSGIFSGNSRFAYDFQSVIDRSVSIASLPLQQLNDVKTSLEAQSTALQGLSDKFSAVQAALESLDASTGVASLTASVSDPTIAEVHLTSGAMEGTYWIEVTSLGSYTSTLSKDGLPLVSSPYTQSLSSSASFTLTVNGTTYTVTPAANTLDALARAINSLSGASVRASIVNVGSGTAPDYRLSIQGTRLDADSIQLNDGATDLLDTLITGSNAAYKVNGRTTAVQTDTRTITLAPGVTVDLLAQSAPGQATTITVGKDPTAIRDALSSFITAYNAAIDAIDDQRGENPGALAGQSLVFALSRSLRAVTSYSGGSGAISSLAAAGIELDQFGKLSLDSAKFDAADFDALLTFLGSADGTGFLASASATMDRAADPDTGTLAAAITSTKEQIRTQEDRIADEQERIDLLRESLAAKMAAADALIASMEQQVTYLNGLFESMRISQEMNS